MGRICNRIEKNVLHKLRFNFFDAKLAEMYLQLSDFYVAKLWNMCINAPSHKRLSQTQVPSRNFINDGLIQLVERRVDGQSLMPTGSIPDLVMHIVA